MNRPRIELQDGAVVFIFEVAGNEFAYPCTVEGATEFALELAAKLNALKDNPELMKKLSTHAVNAVVDWFTKKKAP